MNKIIQERKFKLLQQKIPITQTITLYSKINEEERYYTDFWGLEIIWTYSREKKCSEIRKSKSDISQEQKLKTYTTMQFLYSEVPFNFY